MQDRRQIKKQIKSN